MDLDGDAVADPEFIDGRTEADDRAHVFVTGCEAPVERELAIDQGREAMLEDFDICSADCDRIDPHQYFGRAGLGHRFLDELEFLGVAEHPGLHRLRDRVLVGTVLVHQETPDTSLAGAGAGRAVSLTGRARLRSNPD